MTLTPTLDNAEFFLLCHPLEYFFMSLFAFESLNAFNYGSVPMSFSYFTFLVCSQKGEQNISETKYVKVSINNIKKWRLKYLQKMLLGNISLMFFALFLLHLSTVCYLFECYCCTHLG